jgi:hypothetical protein
MSLDTDDDMLSVTDAECAGWGDEDFYATADVARCACGTGLEPDELLQGLCGPCFQRIRIPRYRGAELVSERLRRRYRSLP